MKAPQKRRVISKLTDKRNIPKKILLIRVLGQRFVSKSSGVELAISLLYPEKSFIPF